jgi:two-component system OmpR family response regulator
VERGGRRLNDGLSGDVAPNAAGWWADGEAPRILVVDDYLDGREMVSEYLTYLGFEVAAVRTGAEAIERAASFLPDVVLMDVLLPDADGINIIRQLRARAERPMKFIVFTAAVISDVRSRAHDASADLFIPKPCDLSVLGRQVRHLVRADAPQTT